MIPLTFGSASVLFLDMICVISDRTVLSVVDVAPPLSFTLLVSVVISRAPATGPVGVAVTGFALLRYLYLRGLKLCYGMAVRVSS